MNKNSNKKRNSGNNPNSDLTGDENEYQVILSNEKPKIITNKISDPPSYSPPMDQGMWGWVVCFASFWTNGTIFGVINTYGTVLVELNKKYEGHDNLEVLTPLIGSLCIGMTFLLSPIAGILTDRCGIRKVAFAGSCLATLGMLLSSFVERLELLYITYGLMLGIGSSLAYTPSLVILGHYFQKYMGLINGIVTFGSSVFTIVLPLLLNELFKTVGLQVTFQILTVMMASLLLCSLTFKPRLMIAKQPEIYTASMNYNCSWKVKCHQCFTHFINVSIWKNKRYVIWALTIPAALFGYFVPYVHLVYYVQKILPKENGNILLTCIGATSGVGRIIFGKLADFPWVNRIFLQQLSFFCIGVLTMLLPATGCFPVLIAMCLGLGLFDGCFISLLGPIAFDIIGPQGASQAIGFLLGLCSIPLTVGPPIAGWIAKRMDSYTVAFICAGIPPILGALIMFSINRVKTASGETNNETLIQITGSLDEKKENSEEEAATLMSDCSGGHCIWQKQGKVSGGGTSSIASPGEENDLNNAIPHSSSDPGRPVSNTLDPEIKLERESSV